MWSRFSQFFGLALILISLFPPLFGEDPSRSEPARADLPETPYVPHSHPLTRSSGYIFAGTVKSVERAAPKGNGVATVVINFRVDQAMRGVRAGQTLAIREWAGLWQSGERYRPGERVLLFLYPPSKLGLTSPVGGPLGRFRVDPTGRAIINPGRIAVKSRHPAIAAQLRGKTRVNPRELVRYFQFEDEE